MSYGNQECMPSTIGVGRNLTISERLYQQKKDLTERLALIEQAIKAVEEVPNLQQALNAISKVGF
jgi:hypothetical protein